MRRLLAFLFRYRLTIIFLLVESACLGWMFYAKSYPRSVVFRNTQNVTAVLQSWRSSVGDFFSLQEQNRKLNEENARLRSALRSSYFELFSAEADQQWDTLMRKRYSYFPAKVINHSFTRRNNYLSLDKGRVHGIKEGMGVISEDGLVGVVKSCSKHFSTVVPLLHSRFRTSGQLQKSAHFGTVRWPGRHYRNAMLEDIPRQASLSLGDTVYSTSYSGVFPAGIPIGRVMDFSDESEDLFKNAELRLSVDFSALRHVQVVASHLWPELDSLQTATEAE